MRVAVTGAGGRLGSALVTALGDAPFTGPAGPIAWTRDEFDLDAPESIGRLLDRDRPEVVVHTAAWTDVDGCARDPDLAKRRNGDAVRAVALATVDRGIDLIQVSTNEVFDGNRAHDRGYRVDDEPSPANPYGASKLAGEDAAAAAYGAQPTRLAIVRTGWLYGMPGDDFPEKILAAAERASLAGQPLKVVTTPTSSFSARRTQRSNAAWCSEAISFFGWIGLPCTERQEICSPREWIACRNAFAFASLASSASGSQ